MGDSLAPFTGPYMRALQIKSFVDDIAAKREERERDRARFQMDLQQHQRANAFQDYIARMHLQDIGAMPAEIGASPQKDAAWQSVADITPENARPLMQTPVGTYRLPNQGDKTEKMIRDETEAGTAAGYRQNASDAITNPMVDVSLPPELGMGTTAKVPKKEQGDYLLKVAAALEKKLGVPVGTPIINKETGDATFHDNKGNVIKVIPGVGGARAPAGQAPIPDFDVQMKAKADNFRPGIYRTLNITPEIEKRARGETVIGYTQDDHLPVYDTEGQKEAAAQIAEADKEVYRRAYQSVMAENKGRRAQPATTTPAPKAGASTSIRGQKMTAANAAIAAQRKGMTAEQFSQWWHTNGGIILP